MTDDTLKKILAELEMIKKIKIIELVDRGYSQSKIGDALGVSQATVSRMLASKKPAAASTNKKSADDE